MAFRRGYISKAFVATRQPNVQTTLEDQDSAVSQGKAMDP